MIVRKILTSKFGKHKGQALAKSSQHINNMKEENSLLYLSPKRHCTQHTEFVELDEGETMSSEYVIKVDDSLSYFTPNEFDENIDKLIYENNLTEMNQKT